MATSGLQWLALAVVSGTPVASLGAYLVQLMLSTLLALPALRALLTPTPTLSATQLVSRSGTTRSRTRSQVPAHKLHLGHNRHGE